MGKATSNQKDCQNHQMGIDKMDRKTTAELKHWQKLHENDGRTRYPESTLSVKHRSANRMLQRIFEVLPNELIDYPDDLPTSFVAVETEIARCISGCLADAPEQMRDISYIQSLVRDYRVVSPVRVGNPTVSLHAVHLIVQDNFEGSCFWKLLNILATGFMNTETKLIDL